MKYRFNNVVFTPDTAIKLTVDGEVRELPKRQVHLLKYFLDTNGQISDKNTILDSVWGPGEHTHAALATALSHLNKKLPLAARVETIRNQGHILNVELTIVEFKYKKLEMFLEKSPYAKSIITAAIAGLFLLSVAAFGATFVNIMHWLNPPVAYTVQDIKPLFTRDYLVGTPQLSPDGRYLAHRLSRQVYEDDYLGLLDLKLGDTKPLVRMGFTDGYEWNLTGDKIVYQRRWNGSCHIRLLVFNTDKTIADDKLLTECEMNGDNLSFAWFNDHEFYVNLVAGDDIVSENRLPQHHLYSFDIHSLQTTKIATADYQGGVGFYSLEYDASVNALYLLKTTDFISTDFYRYQNGSLSQLSSVEYLVKFYTVANNRLIYKNNHNQLVINQPAADFAGQKILLTSPMMPMDKPHNIGNKLTFLGGDTYRISLHQWADNQITDVRLEGFDPSVLARYKTNLIFTSDQTGIYQVYMRSSDNRPQQISNMSSNEYIQHIDVVDELFVISYLGKVEIYRYVDNQLQLLKTLPGYSKGVLNANAETILLTELTHGNTPDRIIEMQWDDLQPTGLVIEGAKLALYHDNDVVYLNQDNELIRLVANKRQVIAANINISSLELTDLQGDKFYYIAKQSLENGVGIIDLSTGMQTTMVLDVVNPSKIEVINDQLFIRAWQTLQPKVMLGTITQN